MSILFLVDMQALAIMIMIYLLISFGSTSFGTKGYKQIRNGMFFSVLFEVTDLICTLWGGDVIVIPWKFAYYLNAAYVLSGTLAGMMLYSYMGEILGKAPGIIRRIEHTLFFSNVLILTSVIAFENTGFFISPDGNSINVGFLYYIWLVVLLVPFVLMVINSIRYFFKKENYANRENAVTIIVLSLICFFGGVLQFLIPKSTFAAMAFFLSVLFMYSKSIKMTVNNDELTGLYNRRQMLKDANENILSEKHWCFVMIDANSFKSINDGYGHAEGDAALRSIAKVLRESAGIFRGEAYRYGGDEFVIILENEYADRAEELCTDIDERMENYVKEKHLHYRLSVSCGYAAFDLERYGSIPDIIEAADTKMYEIKQRKKAQR